MNTGRFLKLRQLTNQLFAYGYSIVFVLIGGRFVLLIQQALGFFWPCEYVEAWWQVQGSTPSVMACSESGRESTVVVGTAIAFGIVLALMRQLEWRLRLVVCVAGLYFLLRLGYLFNALGREPAMTQLSNAIYITRLEIAGLAILALIFWLIHYKPRWRRVIGFSIAALLLGAVSYEIIQPSGGSGGSYWKAISSTLSLTLVCVLLGYLPAKTARWLRVGT